jgi:hypothetical protein
MAKFKGIFFQEDFPKCVGLYRGSCFGQGSRAAVKLCPKVCVSALPLSSWVTLGKLPHFSESQFPRE